MDSLSAMPKQSEDHHPQPHDPDWEPPIPGRRRILRSWDEYLMMAKRIIARFDHKFDLKHFDYHHPVRLQSCSPRFRKPYPVKVAYTDWGDPASERVVICVHGLTRNGRDFDDIARTLSSEYRVLCPDVPGRGKSEWLTHKEDYSYPVYCADMAALVARRRSRSGSRSCVSADSSPTSLPSIRTRMPALSSSNSRTQAPVPTGL